MISRVRRGGTPASTVHPSRTHRCALDISPNGVHSSEQCSRKRPETAGRSAGTPPGPRSSRPPGRWPARAGWRRCRSGIWLAGSACRRRRCTRTSSPRTRSTTRCSPRARRPTSPTQRGALRTGDPLEELQAGMRGFVQFCTEDPVRYQLLFQRTIPGFEPTPETYAISVDALELVRGHLTEIGLTDPKALDLLTAIGNGLADQQISNDPGGDRWSRLVDEAMEMFFNHVTDHRGGGPASDDHDTDRPGAGDQPHRSRRARGNREPADAGAPPPARRRGLGQAHRLPGLGRAGDGRPRRRDDGDVRVAQGVRPRDAGGTEGGRRRSEGRRHDRRAGGRPGAPQHRPSSSSRPPRSGRARPGAGAVSRRCCARHR